MGTYIQIRGTYGFCTIIADTTLYNWVTSNGLYEHTLYNNSSVTEFGTQFLEALQPYSGKLNYTLLQNLAVREYDATAIINVFKNFISDITYSQFFLRSQTAESFNSESQSSFVRLTPDTEPFGGIKIRISIDNSNWYTMVGQAETFPYGAVDVRRSYANAGFVLPVFNDDMTAAYGISIATASDSLRVSYYPFSADSSFIPIVNAWLNGIKPYVDNEDPYSPGRTSTHGGGGRSFDDSSDPVGLPVPSGDYALNSGFLTMYQVNASKLNDLASFMWNTSLFDVNTWQKIMSNPFDAIISLTAIPASPGVLSDRAIKIGNVVTNVSAPVVADQFVRINCGTLDVEEYSGSYLDYSPYTKVEIYLPYIGFRDLNTDEVMDKTLSLVYNVDVLSGACVANILVGDTVLYQFAGDCAMQIPVTGRDPAKTLSSVLGVVTSAGSLAGGAILGTLNPQSAVKAVTATAESVIGGKRNIQRSGNISGSAGFMGGQTPYLIITRPRQALPEEQNLFMGYPSFITSTLGDLSGMTIVADCHLENIPCTDGELQEIERLLKEGVIL